MAYNFSAVKERFTEITQWLQKEYSVLRTGRATPALLDGVSIDVYGAMSPISHVATLSIEDARTIRISPWDKSHIKGIESAIAASNLGVSTAPDQDSIRVIFPTLSSERRLTLEKLAKEKLEEARVSIRKERESVLSELNAKEKSKEISEDEKFRLRNDLQKIVDEANLALEKLFEKKEAEIKE